MPAESLRALRAFFESAPVARQATRPLTKDAEVALVLAGGEPARFTMESGEPRVLAGLPRNPDFTLRLPEGAVSQITGLQSEDVGEYGVAFFTMVRSQDPALKIKIQVEAPTLRLLGHGYLGVLAIGGMKVSWWLLKNGIKNPKAAIDRLRSFR